MPGAGLRPGPRPTGWAVPVSSLTVGMSLPVLVVPALPPAQYQACLLATSGR